MTERERRALLRRRPDVSSWRRLLDTARSEHDRLDPELALDPLVPQQGQPADQLSPQQQ